MAAVFIFVQCSLNVGTYANGILLDEHSVDFSVNRLLSVSIRSRLSGEFF